MLIQDRACCAAFKKYATIIAVVLSLKSPEAVRGTVDRWIPTSPLMAFIFCTGQAMTRCPPPGPRANASAKQTLLTCSASFCLKLHHQERGNQEAMHGQPVHRARRDRSYPAFEPPDAGTPGASLGIKFANHSSRVTPGNHSSKAQGAHGLGAACIRNLPALIFQSRRSDQVLARPGRYPGRHVRPAADLALATGECQRE